MRTLVLIGMITIALLVAYSAALIAHETTGQTAPWVVHRTFDGQLSRESMKVAEKMQRKAAAEGYITLWVLPTYEGEWNAEILTDERHARNCAHILQPLINQGQVWHPDGDPINHGPVCLVRASGTGVSVLLRDKRLQQIMGAH